MDIESSPFSPGQPVPTEYFIGRYSEIERLRSLVKASTKGKFKIAFVIGERGIGKSSLVSFVKHLGEREDHVTGTHVFLGGTHDLQSMVWQTFDKLLKDSIEKPWYKKLAAFFGKHIKQVGLFGVSVALNLTDDERRELAHNFVRTVRELFQKLRDDRESILIILDDINGLAASLEFANWLKSLVDEIATSGEPLNLCIVIVGTEDRRHALLQLQPSLGRVFELIELAPWTQDESRDFFKTSFENQGVTISDKALLSIVHYTGGLPVLGHEIGDSIWRILPKDTKEINSDLAITGVMRAAESVGRKFLDVQVYKEMSSERYQSIFRILCSSPQFFSGFKRADLISGIGQEEIKVVDNFLKRMKELNVLETESEKNRGHYKFVNNLHWLYFMMKSAKTGKTSSSPEQ
jgi:AAA+ ATPase superfamily predicted ATPase